MMASGVASFVSLSIFSPSERLLNFPKVLVTKVDISLSPNCLLAKTKESIFFYKEKNRVNKVVREEKKNRERKSIYR